jgi:hypothetical protein
MIALYTTILDKKSMRSMEGFGIPIQLEET